MMHWRADHQKLPPLARWTAQNVIELTAFEIDSKALYQRGNVHRLVVVAIRIIRAVEMQRVVVGQIAEVSV
jgi:hypothetical protein